MSETAALIKRIRERFQLSQSEIARRTGIPQPRISRWENSSELVGDDVLKLAELERQLEACAKEAA
jgi:transcriptional regulator with XRE-family HTH domain